MTNMRCFSIARLIAALLLVPPLTHGTLIAVIAVPIIGFQAAVGTMEDAGILIVSITYLVGMIALPTTFIGVGTILAPMYYLQAKRLDIYSEATLAAFGLVGVPIALAISGLVITAISTGSYSLTDYLGSMAVMIGVFWPFGVIYALVATAYFIWITRPAPALTP